MYTQTEKVNIKPKSYLPVFRVSQNDVGRTLTAHLVSDDGDISIPSGATVTMAGTKPSGLGYTVTGTFTGSDVSFDTDAVMTDEAGRIVSEIRITDGDTLIGTTNVVLSIEPNPHPDDTTDGQREPLVNEITALLEQITEKANQIASDADRAEQAVTDAVQAKDYAQQARDEAQAANSSALQAQAKAEQAKVSAENAMNTASAAANAAGRFSGNSRESAEAAKQSETNASASAAQARASEEAIENMTVSAHAESGSVPTVTKTEVGGSFNLDFGLIRGPKGDTGQTGAIPDFSIGTVATLEPNESATATITGTAEEPILNLGLPKGEQGDVSLDELLTNTIAQTKTDSVPYLFRQSGNGEKIGSFEFDKIVGGTVAWNQICANGNFANGTNLWSSNKATISAENGVLSLLLTESGGFVNATRNVSVAGHKYVTFADINISNGQAQLITSGGVSRLTTKTGSYETVGAVWVSPYTGPSFSFPRVYDLRTSGWDAVKIKNVMVFDLTAMFGSTIADYIYSLEQAIAGAGVAWFKKLFPEDYYPYDAGTLKSVEGLSAHVMKDADGNVIGNYPLDNSLTLRGIPKLDSSNNLYYDGDEYESDGTVTRKYGIVDLGTLNWTRNEFTSGGFYYFRCAFPSIAYGTSGAKANVVCSPYTTVGVGTNSLSIDKTITTYSTQSLILIRDDSYTDVTAFKTAMSGVMLVYELATPTTETAEPYNNPQAVDAYGTEEYVTTNIVPVGHITEYPMTIIDTMPDANGTYSMTLTVANGKKTINWQ